MWVCGCVCVCVCGCVGVWVCGCVGVWVWGVFLKTFGRGAWTARARDDSI